MDLLTNNDELLLMELERRDGIYSFIFHELENHENNQQTENQTNLHPKTESGSSLGKSTLTCNSIELEFSSERLSRNSSRNVYKTWLPSQELQQLNLNYQIPSFQQICSLRSLTVRRAKSPFSHIQAPMVRNRRHKLKETKEYRNFMSDITKVPDLRDLFPLDPDVHAPFLDKSEKEGNRRSNESEVKKLDCLK
ncbi:uncharacterized protein ACRADG_008799 [Cochliomyia hominivorax]